MVTGEVSKLPVGAGCGACECLHKRGTGPGSAGLFGKDLEFACIGVLLRILSFVRVRIRRSVLWYAWNLDPRPLLTADQGRNQRKDRHEAGRGVSEEA